MKAIACSYATASQLANVADQLGSVSVYKGTYEQCENVADILGSVGLVVKVSQQFQDSYFFDKNNDEKV